MYIAGQILILLGFVFQIIFFAGIHSIWVGILLFAGAVFVTTVLLLNYWEICLQCELSMKRYGVKNEKYEN